MFISILDIEIETWRFQSLKSIEGGHIEKDTRGYVYTVLKIGDYVILFPVLVTYSPLFLVIFT